MKIIVDFLKSFKPDTTIGELLNLIENDDIDMDKMISNIIDDAKL